MRSVSLPFLQAALAQQTGEAPIALATINHASLAAPIRVTNYDVAIVSRGDTYSAFPFQAILPNDSAETAPRSRLMIDNVDRSIGLAMRAASGDPPAVSIEVILASSPDTVEASFAEFPLRDVRYDDLTVQGDIALDSLASEPFPGGRFLPGTFPGMF